MKNDSGFSLIELAVAMAIFAILSAIAIPNMIRWRKNSQFRSAVNALTGDLAASKQAAIRGNANAVITFSEAGYRIFLDDGSGGGGINDGVQNGTEPTFRDRTLPAGVTFDLTASTFAGNGTRFNGQGLCLATGSVTVNNDTDQSVISVNRIGRINAS